MAASKLVLIALLAAPWVAAQGVPTPDLPCLDCCPNPPCDPIGPPPPSEPPVRAAFYYPWWDGYDTINDRPRRKWSECTTTWSTDDGDTGDHYHPDFNGNGLFEKAIDLYDDGLVSTMVTHMQRMSSAAVGGLIASWWGPDSGSGRKFGTIWNAAQQVSAVDVTGYYETYRTDGSGISPESMAQFVRIMLSYHHQDPSRFLKTADARPVLFVYDPGNHDCSRLDDWKAALDSGEQRYGVRAFLVVDMGNEVPSQCTNWNPADFAWHEYAPPSSQGYVETWAAGQLETVTIRPGFWRCRNGSPGQVRSLIAWQNNVLAANAAHPEYFQLVTSWNEWLEMTAVEPGVEWASPSGLGDYLDVLGTYPPY